MDINPDTDIDWIKRKLIYNEILPVFPGNFSTFGRIRKVMNQINGVCAYNDLCIIDVIVNETPVRAMIDTGASSSFISNGLVQMLGLPVFNNAHTNISSFKNFADQTYTEATLAIPELFGQEGAVNSFYIDSNIVEKNFDMILGCDFLNYVKFERDGVNKTFSLIINQ